MDTTPDETDPEDWILPETYRLVNRWANLRHHLSPSRLLELNKSISLSLKQNHKWRVESQVT